MRSVAAEPKRAPELLLKKIISVEDVKVLFDLCVYCRVISSQKLTHSVADQVLHLFTASSGVSRSRVAHANVHGSAGSFPVHVQ